VDCQAAAIDDVPLVPVLVYVQRLARMLQDRDEDATIGSSILVQYFAREYGVKDEARGQWLAMLAQALQMRTLVVVLDGIDEAAGRRNTVSRFVREVLVPEGFRVVCTSRPEGVSVDDFLARFVVFDLEPLSDQQQLEMMRLQLQSGSGMTASLEVRILSSLDDRLVWVLHTGDIRLLRTAWLLSQPEGYRIQNRQKLEELEKAGESPLLTREEAVKLIRQGNRGVGGLSYGWLSPGNPDPAGKRVEVVCQALRHKRYSYIEGLFWECVLLRCPPAHTSSEALCVEFLSSLTSLSDTMTDFGACANIRACAASPPSSKATVQRQRMRHSAGRSL